LTVTSLKLLGGRRQIKQWRAGVVAKGGRLGRPVELGGAFGVAVEAMLGAHPIR
jgi:hypothetical protein